MRWSICSARARTCPSVPNLSRCSPDSRVADADIASAPKAMPVQRRLFRFKQTRAETRGFESDVPRFPEIGKTRPSSSPETRRIEEFSGVAAAIASASQLFQMFCEPVSANHGTFLREARWIARAVRFTQLDKPLAIAPARPESPAASRSCSTLWQTHAPQWWS